MQQTGRSDKSAPAEYRRRKGDWPMIITKKADPMTLTAQKICNTVLSMRMDFSPEQSIVVVEERLGHAPAFDVGLELAAAALRRQAAQLISEADQLERLQRARTGPPRLVG